MSNLFPFLMTRVSPLQSLNSSLHRFNLLTGGNKFTLKYTGKSQEIRVVLGSFVSTFPKPGNFLRDSHPCYDFPLLFFFSNFSYIVTFENKHRHSDYNETTSFLICCCFCFCVCFIYFYFLYIYYIECVVM